MRSPRIALITVAVFSFIVTNTTPAKLQALNPSHLSEMPSVDRVMRAMQTADARETAERQVGAFYQLIEIIKTLSGRREFRGLTPDEARIVQTYTEAQYSVSQAADKAFGRPMNLIDSNNYRFGRWDRRFGVEGIQTFKTFFSPALKAEFDKIVAGDNARREAREQSYRNDATPAAAQPVGAAKPGSQAELRKCIESGRSQRVCFSESMNNGMDQLSGIPLQQMMAPGPGLRMTGDYSSAGGFRLIFQPQKVTMVCHRVPTAGAYTVEMTDTQTLVKIPYVPKAVVFALRQDGKLSGTGPIRVTGQVPSGSHTEETAGMTSQKTTRTRELSPGEERYYPNATKNGQVYTVKEDSSELVYGPTGSRTVTDYVTKTADCNLGLMTATGPTPLPPDIESPFGLITTIFSGAAVLMKGGTTEAAAKEMLSPDKQPPPGLRMSGKYVGANGFSVTFHHESATVACGDAERALEYSLQRNAGQTLVKIQDPANPITLQLRPDGSLFGEGTVQVNGRTIVGTTEDPNNQFIFAPKVERCAMGSLVVNDSTPSSQPANTAPSTTTSNTAANATPSAANVSLSIVSGFANQPGVANPLAGKTLLIVKESFETILRGAGWAQPGSSTSAVASWARACESRNPSCQQGIEAVRPYLVASGKLDGNGGLTFPNAKPGVYYLVLQIAYNGRHLVWNLPIELKPGAKSVTLDERNTTPIDR